MVSAVATIPRPGVVVPPNGNPGVVPPWLQKPPVISLPVVRLESLPVVRGDEL